MPLTKSDKLVIGDKDVGGYVKKADRGFAPEHLPVRRGTSDLAGKLYGALERDQASWPQVRVYASGIRDCARRVGFTLMGFTPGPIAAEERPEWGFVADIGTLIHSFLEEYLSKVVKVIAVETKLYSDDDSLSGKYDALLDINGVQAVLDIKTVGTKDYEDGPWGRKFSKYYDQIQVYGALSGSKLGIVLLVCRNDGRMTDYEFDIDEEYGQALLDRASFIKQQSDARQVLPAEWLGSRACDYCPFKRQCGIEESTGSIQFKLDQGADPKDL